MAPANGGGEGGGFGEGGGEDEVAEVVVGGVGERDVERTVDGHGAGGDTAGAGDDGGDVEVSSSAKSSDWCFHYLHHHAFLCAFAFVFA